MIIEEVEEWIRAYRILLMKKIAENKLKFSFLFYSKLKSADWVSLNPECYGPGAGPDHSASLYLGFCPFLEKLTKPEVWTGNLVPIIPVPIFFLISLHSVVQHGISSSCYCNCNSRLGLKPSKLLKCYNCLKEMALFPPDKLLDHSSMTSCVFWQVAERSKTTGSTDYLK